MSIQKRGEALKQAIRNAILAEKAEADKAGKVYAFNAVRLAESLPVSRTTIQKHLEYIDDILDSINARRRVHSGEGQRLSLQARLDRTKKELEAKTKAHDALAISYGALLNGVMMSSNDPTLIAKLKRHIDRAAEQGGLPPTCPHCHKAILDAPSGDVLPFKAKP